MKGLTRVIIIVVVVLAAYGLYRYTAVGMSGLIPSSSGNAKEGYSAVFLANDQVYFGKVATRGSVLILKDVYYIRLDQTQPQIDKNSDNKAQPQLTLVKLGDQIHGPEDEMRINSDQVLFIERIKDDSTVVKGILQDKESRASKKDETPLNNDANSTSNTATDQSATQ